MFFLEQSSYITDLKNFACRIQHTFGVDSCIHLVVENISSHIMYASNKKQCRSSCYRRYRSRNGSGKRTSRITLRQSGTALTIPLRRSTRILLIGARRLWVSISALNRIRCATRTVACSLGLSFAYESRENVPSCDVFTVFGVFCFLCDCSGCRPTPR